MCCRFAVLPFCLVGGKQKGTPKESEKNSKRGTHSGAGRRILVWSRSGGWGLRRELGPADFYGEQRGVLFWLVEFRGIGTLPKSKLEKGRNPQSNWKKGLLFWWLGEVGLNSAGLLPTAGPASLAFFWRVWSPRLGLWFGLIFLGGEMEGLPISSQEGFKPPSHEMWEA